MSAKPTTADCCGCENDFYNGHNDLNVKRCWSLDSATFEKARDVHIQAPPPYKHLPLTKRPSCYKAKCYVRVKPDALTADGFWKGTL